MTRHDSDFQSPVPRSLFVASLAATLLMTVGCSGGHGSEGRTKLTEVPPVASSVHLYPTTIHRPYPSLGMNTKIRNHKGLPARVPCRTCHGFVGPKAKYKNANKLEKFHKGVEVVHGGQSCRTCHSVPGFEGFNLAGGKQIGYEEVMRLCGQCHSDKLNEYEHGAHGGMNGYWDRTRGPRSRNHCIDCHNPHAPAIKNVRPAAAPNYRKFD